MKKLLSIILSVICLFATASCGSKETTSTDYTGLYIDGIKDVYYTKNSVFTLPSPTVRNKKGEKCDLEVVCSVADNANRAVPKENGKIKVDAGVYRMSWFLKDYNYDCKTVKAMLVAEDERETTLVDFETQDELSRVCEQPKQNFGTNNGTVEWIDTFENMQGVLKLTMGEGCQATPTSDRDGCSIVFDEPITLSTVDTFRIWYYVDSQRLNVCSNFGFGYGDSYAPDNFWYQPVAKGCWITYDIPSSVILSRWTECTGYLDRMYIRSYMAVAGDAFYVAKITYIPKSN